MLVFQVSLVKYFIVFILLAYLSSPFSYAQTKIKIGVYDSRAVAVAYFNSEYGSPVKRKMAEMHDQLKKARDEHDSVSAKKLRVKGPIIQAVLHEKGFGCGSVRYEMLEIKEKIDSLAKAEKCDLIVSKWELNFTGSNVETVDLSEKIASLFNPNPKFMKMIPGLMKSDPVKDAYLIED